MNSYLDAYTTMYFPNTYAEGANKSTAGKPLQDGNFDRYSNMSPQKIRKQAHWLNVNNTDIPAIIAKATARIVGVNVNIKVESPNKNFNSSAEAFLRRFHKLKVGEITNKHHGNSAFRAMANFDMLDGGIIVRHHYNSAWAIPYKYELVPVDMIDISQNTYTYEQGKPYTLNGLSYNEWNQITAIHLYTDSNKFKSEEVSIENITYYSEVWVSLGQQTAISRLASMMPLLDQVSQYQISELNNAIEAAKSGAYLKSSAYNEIMLILKDQISTITAKKGESKLDQAIDYAKPILDKLSSIGVKPYGTSPIPSEDEVQFDPRKRDGIYKELNDKAEMKLSASIGFSDLSIYSKADKVNYSAMKYVSETDQLNANIKWDDISNKIINEINSRAIEVGVQIGDIPERVAYWKSPDLFKQFSYLRQIYIDIEPAKNATANKTNIETGVKHQGEIVEERTGQEYDVWLEEKQNIEMKNIDSKLKLEAYEKKQREKMELVEETNPEGENNNV